MRSRKAIVNSISLKEGEKAFRSSKNIQSFGAAIVMAFDEEVKQKQLKESLKFAQERTKFDKN